MANPLGLAIAEINKVIAKPVSATTDALIAIACGVAVWLLLGLVAPILPFGEALRAAAAGVAAAWVYSRARANLLLPVPGWAK